MILNTPQHHKVTHGPVLHWLWEKGLITQSSSEAAVVLVTISSSNRRKGGLYWLKAQQDCWKSVQTSLFSRIRAVRGTTAQEAISKATIILAGPSHQRIPRTRHYSLHIHYLLFCFFFSVLAPAFQTATPRRMILTDLINLQEQLRSSVRKCPTFRLLQLGEYIICSAIMPAGSYSGFLQAGTDVSHYGLLCWKIMKIIWKNKYNSLVNSLFGDEFTDSL